MKRVINFFLSSLALTIFSVTVVFISSIKLETKTFSEIVYFLYLIPLLVEFCIFGQYYSILRYANKKNLSNGTWKLDRRKLYLGVLICCFLVFYFSSSIQTGIMLFVTVLMFMSLRLISAFLRVNGHLFMSVVAERGIQITVSLVLVTFMALNNITGYLNLILLIFTVFLYLLFFTKFSNNFPIVNSSIEISTDTTYEINMFFTICSMLIVKSLDKIIVANYFMPYEFSKFVILFQLYLPFPILAGFIFQYYMPKLASKGRVSFSKLYSGLVVLICFFLWYFISEFSYWFYSQVYSGKYDFTLDEIRTFIAAGFLFFLYQPLALVIVTISDNKNLLALNILNVLSVGSYLYFLILSVQENTLYYAITGFLIFWIIKLCSGVLVVNKVKKFSWV